MKQETGSLPCAGLLKEVWSDSTYCYGITVVTGITLVVLRPSPFQQAP
jgi:hypothetical protein